MPIEVLYFADLKDVTGKNKEYIDLESYSIRELIMILFSNYPQIKEILWDEEHQNLKLTVSLAINDSIIHQNNRLSIKLFEKDKVAFLLPISGG